MAESRSDRKEERPATAAAGAGGGSGASSSEIELRIVFTTLPQAAAETIVRTLVEEQLAACGNLVAATSIYRWQGELCRDPETAVIMETAADRAAALVERLTRLHPYECPKIVVLAPEQVNAAYLAWAAASTAAR